MSNLAAVEIKAFVPAHDFAVSQQFYRDLGFTLASVGGGVAYFHLGSSAFLLQDFYVAALAENLQMHLQVEDAQAWFEHLQQLDLPTRYGVREPTPLVNQPWGMRDFSIADPSGVCWRIAQNIPDVQPLGRIAAA
ncbi:VOC family protein [Rhodoferax sp.]|uniref:VOC family protein n=1 Tax=Rhodoferax sp. TaxID=50421 RepID=UPI00374D477E